MRLYSLSTNSVEYRLKRYKHGPRAFGRPVINKYKAVRPEEIYSVPSCMAYGVIMLKKSDVGIILKQGITCLASFHLGSVGHSNSLR